MVRKRSSWSVKDVSDAVLATTGAAPSIQKQVVASLKQQKQADVPSKQKQAVVQAQVVKAKCEDKAGDHAHKKRKHDGRIKAKKRTTATTAPALLKDVHFASDNMDNKSQPCDGWMDMDAMLEEQSDNEESSSVGWRRITFPASMPFTEGAAGGFCALEEVEDVQVAYEETANGRVVKFRKLCTDHAQEDVDDAPKDNAQMAIEDGIADDVSSAECSSSVDSDEDAEAIEAMRAFERSIDAQVVKAAPSSTPGTAAREEEEPVDDEAAPIVNDTPNKHWQHYSLNPSIVRAINELGFEKPTEIQERVLPLAIRKRRDIIGAAETVSGGKWRRCSNSLVLFMVSFFELFISITALNRDPERRWHLDYPLSKRWSTSGNCRRNALPPTLDSRRSFSRPPVNSRSRCVITCRPLRSTLGSPSLRLSVACPRTSKSGC